MLPMRNPPERGEKVRRKYQAVQEEIDRIAADRINKGPHEFIPFEDALTAEELAELESMDPDAIPDEDLFE